MTPSVWNSWMRTSTPTRMSEPEALTPQESAKLEALLLEIRNSQGNLVVMLNRIDEILMTNSNINKYKILRHLKNAVSGVESHAVEIIMGSLL